MKRVFADTSYWIALFNPEDDWAKGALRATKELGEVQLVTTQEVPDGVPEFLRGLRAGRAPSGFGSGSGDSYLKRRNRDCADARLVFGGVGSLREFARLQPDGLCEPVRHAGGRHWGGPERPHGVSEGRVQGLALRARQYSLAITNIMFTVMVKIYLTHQATCRNIYSWHLTNREPSPMQSFTSQTPTIA